MIEVMTNLADVVCDALGLDRAEVARIIIDPDLIQVQVLAYDDDGSIRYGDDGIDYRIRRFVTHTGEEVA